MERVLIPLILLLFLSFTVKIQLKTRKELTAELVQSNENKVIGIHNAGNDATTDLERDVPQLIESRGFIQKTHFVITEDGYNLTIHRIVNPFMKGNPSRKEERNSSRKEEGNPSKVVLLQHPLLGSGADFLINSEGGGINESRPNDFVGNNLGFELAYRGFDVWLGNSRGNVYAKSHIFLKPSGKKIVSILF